MKDLQDIRILVVDDSNTNNFLLEGILRKRGFQVSSATRCSEAFKMLKKEERDLVLLDLMMPGISGFDMLDKMKDDENYKDIPVIVISAKTGPKTEREVLAAGANAYLPKPVRIQALVEVVSRVLNIDIS